MTTLALVDDHRLFREGLRALLAPEADITIVAEAEDLGGVFPIVETHRPDVLLIDDRLPGAGTAAITRSLVRREAPPSVIFLSRRPTMDGALEAIAMGARGCVGRDDGANALVRAIHAVAGGALFLPEPLTRAEVDAYLQQQRGGGPLEVLTAREREVFALMIEGLTNEAMATRLVISRRTIETHRASAMHKLGLRTVADVFRFAARHGMLGE